MKHPFHLLMLVAAFATCGSYTSTLATTSQENPWGDEDEETTAEDTEEFFDEEQEQQGLLDKIKGAAVRAYFASKRAYGKSADFIKDHKAESAAVASAAILALAALAITKHRSKQNGQTPPPANNGATPPAAPL